MFTDKKTKIEVQLLQARVDELCARIEFLENTLGKKEIIESEETIYINGLHTITHTKTKFVLDRWEKLLDYLNIKYVEETKVESYKKIK